MKNQSDWMQGLLYAESECKRLDSLSFAEVKCHLQWLVKDVNMRLVTEEFVSGVQDYLNYYIANNHTTYDVCSHLENI